MGETQGQAAGGGRSMLDDMVGVSDMVLLEPLSEDALIENLWNRYNNKDIYVSNDIQVSITKDLYSHHLYQSRPLLNSSKISCPKKKQPPKTAKFLPDIQDWYNNSSL